MKLNILVPDIGATQLGFFISKNINQALPINGVTPVVFFENNYSPCVPPKYVTLHISEAWGQPGITVATSLSTATKLDRFAATDKKLFYVWDLEWLRGNHRSFDFFRSIYGNPDFELIARSQSHKLIIENCFSREVRHIVPDFDIPLLIKACIDG